MHAILRNTSHNHICIYMYTKKLQRKSLCVYVVSVSGGKSKTRKPKGQAVCHS